MSKPKRGRHLATVTRDEARQVDWVETFLIVSRARSIEPSVPVLSARDVRDELI